jgi:hypothetical protein
MVQPEQLAGAVARLDSRDREVLYLSLHKRIPDESLGRLYACTPPAVAHLRAEAIERLADDLGVRRGDELGSVLTALLEPETWAEVEGGLEPAPEALAAPLEERATEAPDGRGRRRGIRFVGAGIVAGCLLAVGGFVGATALVDDDDSDGDGGDEQSVTRRFVPENAGALAAPFPTEPATASCYPTALTRQPVVLYERPGGRRKLRLASRTDWNSPRVLAVVRQRGRWLAVLAPEMRNGEVAWLPAERARLDCVTWSLHADLSRRLLIVRRRGKKVRRIRMGIGRRGNPTPKGRFAVTDKLRVSDGNSPYGCCVLALTGHQTRLPPNWPGGDRLAVHATADPHDLGRRVSLGCMRVVGRQARWLIEKVPLGAPVFVRS